MCGLQWLLLVPACLAMLYLFFPGTVATHCLVEKHLFPAAAFDRGICNRRGMAFALTALMHVSMALAALVGALVAAAATLRVLRTRIPMAGP